MAGGASGCRITAGTFEIGPVERELFDRETVGVGCCLRNSFVAFWNCSFSFSTAVSLDDPDGRFGTRSGTRAACWGFADDLPCERLPSTAARERGIDCDMERIRVGVVDRVAPLFERETVRDTLDAPVAAALVLCDGALCTPSGPHLLQQNAGCATVLDELDALPVIFCTKSEPWSLNHRSISFSRKSGGACVVNISMRPVFLSKFDESRARRWHLRIMRSLRCLICMTRSHAASLPFSSSRLSAFSR